MNKTNHTQTRKELIKTIVKVLDEGSVYLTDSSETAAKIVENIENVFNEKCPFCEASLNKYERRLDRLTVGALIKIQQAVYYKNRKLNGTGHIAFKLINSVTVGMLPDDMKLTHSERCMLSILRHHGLIAKVKKDGKVVQGRWLITRKGWSFLRGNPVPNSVTTFRNKVIAHSEDLVTIYEVMTGDEYRPSLDTLRITMAELPEDLL